MFHTFPQMQARKGNGFAHEIFVAGSMPRQIVANVEGTQENWRLARLFAVAPRLFEALQTIRQGADLCRCNPDNDFASDFETIFTIADDAIREACGATLLIGIEEELARR